MKYLSEAIIDLKAKHKTHGIKVRRLDEMYDENEGLDNLRLKKTGEHTDEGDPEDYASDQKTVEYDIVRNGKKVGEAEYEDYFGYMNGHLYNKHLPEFSGYDKSGISVIHALRGFLKSKTGQKWAANIDKYKPLAHPTNDYRLKTNKMSESVDLEQAKAELENAKRDANSPSANWQTRDKVSDAYDKVNKIKQQIKRDKGEIKSATVLIPDDKLQQVAKELHGMWKKKSHQSIPWGLVHGEKEGTIKVQFNDYDPRLTVGNKSVADLIAHVKKFEI